MHNSLLESNMKKIVKSVLEYGIRFAAIGAEGLLSFIRICGSLTKHITMSTSRNGVCFVTTIYPVHMNKKCM